MKVLFVWTTVYEWVWVILHQGKSPKQNIFQILLILGLYISLGCVMVQSVSRHPLSTETGLNPGPVCVGFMVDQVTLGQVLLQVFWYSPVSIVPPLLHIHSLCNVKQSPYRPAVAQRVPGS